MNKYNYIFIIVVLLLLLSLFVDNTISFQLDNNKKPKNGKLKKQHKDANNAEYEEKSAFHHTDHIEDYHKEVHDRNIFSNDIDLNNLNSTLKLWLESNNIGKFMDLHMTKKLHLSIPVNFIFIGFEGEGNHGLDIGIDQLVEWFQHIEHALKNVISPIGEDYTTTETYYRTPTTHIEYNFEIQVSKTHPMVTTLVEDAIFWHLRSEASHYFDGQSYPGDEKFEKRFYTNPHLLSSLLSSLVKHLEIDSNSYTIFIINPNHPSNDGIENTDAIYGYRVGFSNQELKQIFKNPKLKIPDSLNKVNTDAQYIEALHLGDVEKPTKNKDGQEEEQPIYVNDNLKFRDHSVQSKEWADTMIKQFDEFKLNNIKSNPNCVFGSPDTKEDRWICSSLELLHRENASILERAQEILDSGSTFEQLYIHTAHEFPIFENPLVDTWISHKRFAFIDLTAGPFEWGPSVGGNGLKTAQTLPTPPYLTEEQEDAVLEEEAIHLSPDKDIKSQQLEQELLLIETIFNNACSDINIDATTETATTTTNGHDKTEEEIEMCLELVSSLKKIKKQQALLITGVGATDESLDLDLLTGNYKEVFGNQDQDQFISQLGSVLSSSLKHLVTQPLPLFKVEYSPRVNFNVFVISDHTMEEFNPRHYFYFNYEHFKYEIEKLKVPGQEFTYNINSISMSDDKQLALAYYSSLKTVLNPVINEQHRFNSQLNYYLDSKEIKNKLLKLFGNSGKFNQNDDQGEDGEDDTGSNNNIKYIPIFLFSISTKNSILIDKIHQAKSLSNMVIAIQTGEFSANTTFSVNGDILQYYPINPLSSILAATALNLGGLIGNHIAYSEAHSSATTNWHWSIGDSPTSKTTSFPLTHFNEFQKDSIKRNYIAASIERTIVWMNRGVAILDQCKTSVKNFENALPFFPLEETVLKFQTVRSQLNEISNSLRDLNFKKAISISLQAERSSKSFYRDSLSIQSIFIQSECQSDLSDKLSKRTLAIVCICLSINVLVVLLLKTLYKSKNKLKIN